MGKKHDSQYANFGWLLLVIKLIRIFNIFLTMFMVAGILSDYYKWAAILKVISLIICVLSIGVYYILAFRYK